MPSSLSIEVRGLEETLQRLRAWPDKQQVRILRKAVRGGAAPIVKAARSRIPRRHGVTKRSLTQIVRTYKGGGVTSVVGQERNKARQRFKAKGGRISGGISGSGRVVPIHFIAGKTERHPIRPTNFAISGRGSVVAWRTAGGLKFARRVMHPGTEDNDFLHRAQRASESETVAGFAKKASEAIDKEAAKLEAKRSV